MEDYNINNYPSLLVPHFQPDKPHSLQPYVFSKKNNKRGIQLALNSLSYYEKDYGGHKDFISEFSEIIAKFKKTFAISSINRLGWRYINVIPFIREDHLIPLSRFLNLGINSPLGEQKAFENFTLLFTSNVENGSIATKIEPVLDQKSNSEAILLDFDFFMTSNLNVDVIMSKVEIAHKETRNFFENLITKEYRQYLKGEEIS